MEKTIYDLELHETDYSPKNFVVTRVPGGWIYTWWGDDGHSSTFVPFDNEFQKAD